VGQGVMSREVCGCSRPHQRPAFCTHLQRPSPLRRRRGGRPRGLSTLPCVDGTAIPAALLQPAVGHRHRGRATPLVPRATFARGRAAPHADRNWWRVQMGSRVQTGSRAGLLAAGADATRSSSTETGRASPHPRACTLCAQAAPPWAPCEDESAVARCRWRSFSRDHPVS